jgi:hypothetical protein
VIGEAACPFVEDHGGRRAWREARGDDINEPVTCGWCRSNSVPRLPFVSQEKGSAVVFILEDTGK